MDLNPTKGAFGPCKRTEMMERMYRQTEQAGKAQKIDQSSIITCHKGSEPQSRSNLKHVDKSRGYDDPDDGFSLKLEGS